MRDAFELRVKRTDEAVELHYPVSSAGYGVLVGLVFVGMLYPVVGSSPGLHVVWLVILDLTVVAVAGNAVRLIWLSTVRFDLARDEVRRGLRTIGRISDIQSVEPSPEERAALRLVFVDDRRGVRRWSIPGVRMRDAGELGSLLARELRVPFRLPATSEG